VSEKKTIAACVSQENDLRPICAVSPCPEETRKVPVFAGHGVLLLLCELERLVYAPTSHQVEYLDPEEGVCNFLSSTIEAQKASQPEWSSDACRDSFELPATYLQLSTDCVVTKFPADKSSDFASEARNSSYLDLFDVVRQDLVDMRRKGPL